MYTNFYTQCTINKPLPPVSFLPTQSNDVDFYIKQILPTPCFRSQLPQLTSYQTLNVIKILCCILYVVAIYVIFLLRKEWKEFMKLLGHSSFLVVSSFWRAFPGNRKACSIPKIRFPPLEIKLTLVFWRLSTGYSAADCRHRPLTERHDIAGNTAYCSFWIKATCVLKYPCGMTCCTFVVRPIYNYQNKLNNSRCRQTPTTQTKWLISSQKLTINFVNTVPNRISKYQSLSQHWNIHVRRDMGKCEKVEIQESLHKVRGLTEY